MVTLDIEIPDGNLRLGQKLCNYIHECGYRNENVHVKLFHMQNKEFVRALKMSEKTLSRKFNAAAQKSGKIPS
jgi:hypothetical protein